jgi:hypothetical protein
MSALWQVNYRPRATLALDLFQLTSGGLFPSGWLERRPELTRVIPTLFYAGPCRSEFVLRVADSGDLAATRSGPVV